MKIIDEPIQEARVTREDFSELKAIVREIAEAQKEPTGGQRRTELRVQELEDSAGYECRRRFIHHRNIEVTGGFLFCQDLRSR